MVAYQWRLEIGKFIKNIDQRLALINFKDTNKFRPWDTLKLLANFMRLSFEELSRNTAERLGLPD